MQPDDAFHEQLLEVLLRWDDLTHFKTVVGEKPRGLLRAGSVDLVQRHLKTILEAEQLRCSSGRNARTAVKDRDAVAALRGDLERNQATLERFFEIL